MFELVRVDLLPLLAQRGAVYSDDHIVYTSWKHGEAYVDWVAVLQDPRAAWAAALDLVHRVLHLDFNVVVGPTHTGNTVAYGLTWALEALGKHTYYAYAQEVTEKRRLFDKIGDVYKEVEVEVVVGDRLYFPRSQPALVKGSPVLIVDDVDTTGGTLKKTQDTVIRAGGIPVAFAVGCNRSDVYTNSMVCRWSSH